jgi:hypothetical protein
MEEKASVERTVREVRRKMRRRFSAAEGVGTLRPERGNEEEGVRRR